MVTRRLHGLFLQSLAMEARVLSTLEQHRSIIKPLAWLPRTGQPHALVMRLATNGTLENIIECAAAAFPR
jgi:hypothetical protein